MTHISKENPMTPNDLLNHDSPCVACGAPTVRGVNSAFCSERCEHASACAYCGDLVTGGEDAYVVLLSDGRIAHGVCYDRANP
jgi:hypothetical protein